MCGYTQGVALAVAVVLFIFILITLPDGILDEYFVLEHGDVRYKQQFVDIMQHLELHLVVDMKVVLSKELSDIPYQKDKVKIRVNYDWLACTNRAGVPVSG